MRVIPTSQGKRAYVDLFYYVSVASLTGLPATNVPVGLTKQGLPVGIQVLGPFLEDATCLAIAESLEKKIGGFKPPNGFDFLFTVVEQLSYLFHLCSLV